MSLVLGELNAPTDTAVPRRTGLQAELTILDPTGGGFCPWCGGRLMSELAAHLVDHVLPAVPIRQTLEGDAPTGWAGPLSPRPRRGAGRSVPA